MKKNTIILFALLLQTIAISAQDIKNRSWTDGLGSWGCQKTNSGTYQFVGGYTDYGLDWELKSIGTDKYKVVDADFNLSGNGCTVTKTKIVDGYDAENLVLVARNSKNVVTMLLAERNNRIDTKELFYDMLDGIYTDNQGKQYNFARAALNGEPIEHVYCEGDMSQCFKNGYTFASADLKAHFAKMSWYKPLGDNSKVHLSQLEQLNVDLIKAEEDKQDE